MDILNLVNEIFNVCIIPLLGVLTTFIVKYINLKMGELTEKTNTEIEKKYLTMLNDTISDCVMATSQSYVESLKKQGKFDLDAQKEAFRMTYESILGLLTEDAKIYLNEIIGDLNLYISQKIESEVKLVKNI